MIGIVLAGGMGSRLYPLTTAISKQLLPIFDKPMIFYPISTLMLCGIRKILIVSTPRDISRFRDLLGDGENFGVDFDYLVQHSPNGIAEVFSICKERIQGKKVCLILGDNLFHGNGLGRELSKYLNIDGCHIFGYPVSNPQDYGVLEIDQSGAILGIEEKPQFPKSKFAIPGIYFYNEKVLEMSLSLKASNRGELEISALNQMYLDQNQLSSSILPRGTAWFDTGTFENLSDASNYVRILEQRQGVKVACLEEIAWNQGWINQAKLHSLIADPARKSISLYLQNLLSK